MMKSWQEQEPCLQAKHQRFDIPESIAWASAWPLAAFLMLSCVYHVYSCRTMSVAD